MIEWYKKVVFENYANFNGRATRSEYWNFVLANIIISIILAIIDNVTGLTFGVAESGIIGSLYSLLIFIPSIAVGIRRLHDVGKSGWMYLLLLLFVFIGWIWLIVLLCKDSEDGTNQYGPDPNDIFSNEIDEIGTSEI